MELEAERFMREIAQRTDVYHTDPERVRLLTDDLCNRNEWVYHFFFMGGGTNEHMIALANWWSPKKRPKVLDVGSGTGVCATILAKITGAEFTLMNISEYQLNLTPEGTNFAFKQADMNDPWPFESGSFDEVIMLYSMGHGKLDHIMQEASRVLTKDGGIFIYDTCMYKEIEAAERFKYVFYNPNRVMEEAENAGFYMVRAGIPLTSKYRNITGTLSSDEFYYYQPEPVIYRFVKYGK